MNKILFFFVFALISQPLLAQDKIETIQLNHRLATEILPEIQAFLPEQASARAFNDFIILQADNTTIKQIKQLIDQLDTPLQRVKISVLRTDRQLTEQDGLQISGKITLNNDDLAGSGSVKTWSTKDTASEDQYFQAQGLANKAISIIMSEDIPQQEQYLVLRADGDLAVRNTTHYININNGFSAISLVLPNHQVAVDIHPLFGHFSQLSGTVEKTNLVSSVSGEEGKWILLGETSNGKDTKRQGSTSYRTHEKQQQYIYIKVEQLL